MAWRVRARELLAAVRSRTPELKAFFGCLYYAALRPEEALHLREDEYERPAKDGGWGWLHLTGAAVSVGHGWGDGDGTIENRGLKHRAKTATRDVPVAPPLAYLLGRHLHEFGTGPDGRLFVTRRGPGGMYVSTAGQPVPNNTYTREWRLARESVLTLAQARSPKARVPYSLRHAAVSLWLNAGVPATQVAEWAGHSVHILLKVYAKLSALTARTRPLVGASSLLSGLPSPLTLKDCRVVDADMPAPVRNVEVAAVHA